MIRTHKFCKKKYEVVAEKVDGVCCYGKTVILAKGVDKSANSSLTAIHEALHAMRPKMKESEVVKISTEINRFLRRLYVLKPK